MTQNTDYVAARIEREADKYESNSCPGASPNATPAEVLRMEAWDEGWLTGMRDAARMVRQIDSSGSEKQ